MARPFTHDAGENKAAYPAPAWNENARDLSPAPTEQDILTLVWWESGKIVSLVPGRPGWAAGVQSGRHESWTCIVLRRHGPCQAGIQWGGLLGIWEGRSTWHCGPGQDRVLMCFQSLTQSQARLIL